MKATPLIINWHNENHPIYSAHFEPQGKGRLATAGGDNNVRLWKIEAEGEDRKVEYLSTLCKHTQAVNVVRWAPRGELLASAGDDGNVVLWVPSDNHLPAFGSEGLEDKETWRTKHMCRSSGTEIYDLAWSPDAQHFIIGSMDNVARIYNAVTGSLVRQIAEHSHYVQGVAWDPLNEFIATQSSDRSVHIYSLKTKDGQYTLSIQEQPTKFASHYKTDLPARRMASSSPAPPDMGHRSMLAAIDGGVGQPANSPLPSAPGTPTSVAASLLPMNPPSAVSHSRRSSFSSRRSVSPAPSMPLPAVMPMSIDASPKPHTASVGMKNASLYANETLTSFFRRLTFTPDGSLLLTPAGQYQTQHQSESGRPSYEIINTVYIYTRGGINKPPIAHLPGHKKPSIAVRCSPLIYTLRQSQPSTKSFTIDTSSPEDPIPALPEPISKPSPAPSVMEPPPPPPIPSTDGSAPKAVFSLNYRMVYAVATQDSILLYDTQQQTPICVVSNLHCATFTDLAWSSDGLTLLITSSDGFCSTLSFSPGELGQVYSGEVGPQKLTTTASTPTPTLTSFAPPSPAHHHRNSAGSFTAPSPPVAASFVNSQRPSSPARPNSASSVVTQASAVISGVSSMYGSGNTSGMPTLIAGQVPSITATKSKSKAGVTPPETPRSSAPSRSVPPTLSTPGNLKRETSESEPEAGNNGTTTKRRRIAATPVESESGASVDNNGTQ